MAALYSSEITAWMAASHILAVASVGFRIGTEQMALLVAVLMCVNDHTWEVCRTRLAFRDPPASRVLGSVAYAAVPCRKYSLNCPW